MVFLLSAIVSASVSASGVSGVGFLHAAQRGGRDPLHAADGAEMRGTQRPRGSEQRS